MIFAKPESFPFLDYHNIYQTFSSLFAKDEPAKPRFTSNSTISFLTEPDSTPKVIYNPKTLPSPVVKKSVPPASPPIQSQKSSINLRGKVFSWYDKDGHRHYSNTDYPADNPTLTFQDEIKGEVSVTKIRVESGQVYLPVTFHNNGRNLTVWMALDTGCSITSLNYSFLRQLGVTYTGTSTSILADGSRVKNQTTNVDWVKVGPNFEYNVRINGSKVAGSQNKGLLGLNFLKNHPFKIDFQNEFIAWE